MLITDLSIFLSDIYKQILKSDFSLWSTIQECSVSKSIATSFHLPSITVSPVFSNVCGGRTSMQTSNYNIHLPWLPLSFNDAFKTNRVGKSGCQCCLGHHYCHNHDLNQLISCGVGSFFDYQNRSVS